ncbi:hypothetical protein Ndes2526B_g01600 [Nannochloris sp. 'desiccata']|nr:hypothetical protein KSW81_005898 [Chlorella desiccata (nom. nud.)]KAH7623181.1 hypothetical protein NADE_002375 [Chlorella desiccata (nom. nud.)]
MSIKFGLTEKERILQLAREEDDDPCILSTSQPTTELAVLQAAIKRGPEFFKAIPVALCPIAPFIRVRPKLPRAIRQKVLNKLTEQFLALEAVLMNHTDTSEEVPSPSSIAADVALVKRSVAAAVEQEADMYERCDSAQRLEEKRGKEGGEAGEGGGQRKRSKIDGDGRKYSAIINQNPQLEVGRFTVAATATNSAQQTPLLESDLDWDRAKPEISEDIQELHQELRRRVVQALENCPKWSLLTVDQRVATVERCTLKVKKESRGSNNNNNNNNNNNESIEDTSLQRLAMQYIDFMIKKSKT